METRIEVVVPAGLDSWAPVRLDDGSGDVLHLTPDEVMQLVEVLLDAVHDADPALCLRRVSGSRG